jgi:hypothetical protein
LKTKLRFNKKTKYKCLFSAKYKRPPPPPTTEKLVTLAIQALDVMPLNYS